MKQLYYLFRLIKILFLLTPIFIALKSGKNYGDKLARALQKLGPIFIKFGQSLSTRADLVGEKVADELSLLQDRLPHFSFNEVRKYIEIDFGGSLEDHFSYFEQTPIAAASIAQVHKAVTNLGELVAVKVKRPNIDKKFACDIGFLYFIARRLEKNIAKSKRYSPSEIVATFAKTTKFELDFCFEASAMSEMRDNFAGDETLYIAKPLWELTSNRVLTMEWVEGIPINDLEAIDKAGINRKKIAANLSILFFNQAYKNGFFHGDLHAGNILVNDKNQIILLDFGITGRLSKEDRIFVAEVLRSFLSRDYLRVANIHYEAGYISNIADVVLFAQVCRAIGEPIIGLSSSQVSIAKLLAKLFKVTDDFEMKTRPELLLLQKTILMVEGIGARLDPNVNMWKLAEPWIEDWAIENLGIEAKLMEFATKLSSRIKSLI